MNLAKISAKYHSSYSSHIRGETGATVKNAIEEAITGLPVEVSHFKIGDKSAWEKVPKPLLWERTRVGKELAVTIDQYSEGVLHVLVRS